MLDGLVRNPNIRVGRYSYYSGYYHGHDFDACARYLAADRDDVDKLIIGSFCSIGSGASFIMAGNQGHRTDWIATAVEDGSPDSYRNSDPVLGNIHKTQSLETFAEYLLDNTGDPPGLIFAYTASDAPALDSLRAQDGSVEIVYASMNDLDLHIIFDDPGDQLTTRIENAPANQPRWS